MGICLQVWVCGLRIIGCWLLIVKETHWFLVFRLSYEGEHLRVSTTESSSPPLSFRNLSIPKPRLNYFIEMTGHHTHAPVVREPSIKLPGNYPIYINSETHFSLTFPKILRILHTAK